MAVVGGRIWVVIEQGRESKKLSCESSASKLRAQEQRNSVRGNSRVTEQSQRNARMPAEMRLDG